ncbi:MAG: TetR/AcrR family transcriptional regulator [Rhodospirillales bacterium]|nr:TetR/AcrR family transcriptional regulator [Rhodospirillales bacterium]
MPSDTSQILKGMSRTADAGLVKERRAKIVAGAVRLFAEQGYERTTVQEVAREAGISTGLVYQYVRDKEDLLLLSILDVLESYATEIPAALEGAEGPLQRCRATFAAYCRVVDARREATLLAYRSTYSLPPERQRFIKDAEQKTNRLIGGCIQDCIDEGLFRPVDIDLATYQVVMYAHAWALKHWHFVKRTDLESYISEGLDFFLHALLTDLGRKVP